MKELYPNHHFFVRVWSRGREKKREGERKRGREWRETDRQTHTQRERERELAASKGDDINLNDLSFTR